MVTASPRRAADAERLEADGRRPRRAGPRRGTRSKRRFSTTRSRALGPSSSAKRRNQGCSPGRPGQHVLEDPGALALLRAAQHRLGRPRPAAQDAERVADREQRRVLARRGSRRTAGTPAPPRRGPRGCPGRLGRHAVVLARVDVARPAGAQVERVAVARRLRQHAGAADVEGQDPHPQPGLLERSDRLAARVHDRVDERVVAEVGPAVVHVEDGHVDRPRVGGGHVLRAAPPGRTRRCRRGRSPGSPSRRTAGRAAA